MFCPKCGKQNPDSAAFCGNCGTPFKVRASSGSSAQQVTPAMAAANSVGGKVGDIATGVGATAIATKKNGRIIGITIAVVVVVAVIAAFATGGFGLLEPTITVEPKSSVEVYSWSELSEISAGIAKAGNENAAIEIAKKYNLVGSDGKLDGTQTKSITLSNGKSAQVQIVGFVHDDKTDGGKAGITFIFKDAIASRAMNSNDKNAGGWKDSQMRSWLASDGMNMLPDDLRTRIDAVDKLTNNTGQTKNVSSVNKTSDKLWLFSLVELCGGIPKSEISSRSEYIYDIIQAEGTEYKLFKDCNVAWNNSNNILEKPYNGSSLHWWERSPSPSDSEYFSGVGRYGHPNYEYSASDSYGVVPGFCI